MPTSRRDARQSDPRALSDQKPGRSRNQDEAPPLPSPALPQQKEKAEKERTVPPPPTTPADLERREARARGALPYGTKGSKGGEPAGGSITEEDRRHLE